MAMTMSARLDRALLSKLSDSSQRTAAQYDFAWMMPLCLSGCSADYTKVTYGSGIKLQHKQSGFRLHSHQIKWGSGSGQQSVTGFEGSVTHAYRHRSEHALEV